MTLTEFYQYDSIPKEYWKLRDWVKIGKLEWNWLAQNPAAIHLINAKKHQKNIPWRYLSANPAAIELLMNNPNKIN